MLRAVLDPNVLISATLSSAGAPAELVRRWLDGEFELIVSTALLHELDRALAYPKIRRRVPADDAKAFVELLEQSAELGDGAPAGSLHSRDPEDDYLLDLAAFADAVLVSGDQDLLALGKKGPIKSPRQFLDLLG